MEVHSSSRTPYRVGIGRTGRSAGATAEWLAALKANRGQQPGCRHDAGNSGTTLKVSCLCSASGEKTTIVHVCELASIHRCLPYFHPNKHDRSVWAERKPESDIYQLCDACPNFTPRTA